jgi:hypothetical protein
MKLNLQIAVSLAVVSLLLAAAPAAADPCAAKALAAAEKAYGNDPLKTKVKTVSAGKKYVVTVGIGNAEDGAHDYNVTFGHGCASEPSVSEVKQVANKGQGDVHAAYAKLFSANHNGLPASAKVSASALPKPAATQYQTWSKQGTCSATTAYKLPVGGHPTFAVACAVKNDSIKLSVAIYDARGGSIDQASIYGDSSVGTNGVSWQNETHEAKH